MENLRRWINYDWFKLIVALILLVIFIVLLLQAPAPNPVAGSVVSPTTAAAAATATSPTAATAPAAAAPTASPTSPPPTATALQPTATVPPPTATAQAPSPTPTPTVGPTATPQAQQPAQTTASGDCSKALPTRLDVGKKAQVVYQLNVRAEPGMDKKITLINPPGVRLDIIGGPVCIPYGGGTYRWWNVKMPNGTTGWSAEGSIAGKRYFMEPVP